VVQAVACDLGAETESPLSRPSLADVTARAQAAWGQRLRRSPGWRMLATEAIHPWRYISWIVPRDPPVAETAGPLLDGSAGTWPGKPRGPQDHRLRADEKTSMPARIRCHPALP
jgi:hypothetical protein